jgi:hypothetical protein
MRKGRKKINLAQIRNKLEYLEIIHIVIKNLARRVDQ